MKAEYNLECRVWIAEGPGHTRPILTEGVTEADAMMAYDEEVQVQKGQEYAMVQSMVALAESYEVH